ncbi:MAG: toll/interleukin-1 receptor domain-containing protein [Verrucomicrobiales bacterium]|nr:toll/interleukin-1 receptor domain-containing protein [Verrucomicrobiales bacterium]
MKGINQFGRIEKQAHATEPNAVFISYSRRDKNQALEAANSVKGLGIDIYFDENDYMLQVADEKEEHGKVVSCIEDGLSNSAALLGIVTENTKESWWVPYEIGNASGRQKPHAHLITGEVTHLPSYIKASTILPDMNTLDRWLLNTLETKLDQKELLARLVWMKLRSHQKSASATSIPISRSIDELVFF